MYLKNSPNQRRLLGLAYLTVALLGVCYALSYAGAMGPADVYAQYILGDESIGQLQFLDKWLQPTSPFFSAMMHWVRVWGVFQHADTSSLASWIRCASWLSAFACLWALCRGTRGKDASLWLALACVAVPLSYGTITLGDTEAWQCLLLVFAWMYRGVGHIWLRPLCLAVMSQFSVFGFLTSFASMLFGLGGKKETWASWAIYCAVVAVLAVAAWPYVTPVFMASPWWPLPAALLVSVAVRGLFQRHPQQRQLMDMGVALLLAFSVVMPQMGLGSELLLLPLLFLQGQRHSGAYRALLVFAAFVWLDLYATREFLHIVSQNWSSMPQALQWSMPSQVITILGKSMALGLWWRASRPLKDKKEPRRAGASTQSADPRLIAPPLSATWIVGLLSILVVSGVMMLSGLGSRHFPTTGKDANFQVSIDFAQRDADRVGLWIGLLTGHIQVAVHCQGQLATEKTMERTYQLGWGFIELPDSCRRDRVDIRVTFTKPGRVSEIYFTGQDQTRIPPMQICEMVKCIAPEQHPLFDETASIAALPFPDHGAIVDEMYNTGPGASVLLHLPIETTSETVHPYFGRWLIYQSMNAFGIGPFGWRLPSALAAMLLPLAVFFLARLILASNGWSLVAALLILADGLRISIGRTAFVDAQTTLWIVVHLIFVVVFLRSCGNNARENSRRALSAVWAALVMALLFLTLAATTKLNGIFIAAGTLPMMLWAIYQQWSGKQRWITLTSMPLIFACFWLALTAISYRPFLLAGPLWSQVWQHQTHQLRGHGLLKSTESAAPPATSSTTPNVIPDSTSAMPAMPRSIQRPVPPTHPSAASVGAWLSADTMFRALMIPFYPGGPMGLYIFGNPILWWSILPAALFLLMGVWPKTGGTLSTILPAPKARSPYKNPQLLILLAYFSVVVPWVFIRRHSFNYHYLPGATLGAVMVAAALQSLPQRWGRPLTLGLLLMVGGALVWFAPVIWGIPMSPERLRSLLWFDRWFFEMRALAS